MFASYYGTESPNMKIQNGDMCEFPSNHKTIRMDGDKSARNFFGYDIKSNLAADPRKMYGYNLPDMGAQQQQQQQHQGVGAVSSNSVIPQTEFVCGDVEIIYNQELVAPTPAVGPTMAGGLGGFGLGGGGGGFPTGTPIEVINNYYYGTTPTAGAGVGATAAAAAPTTGTPSPFTLLTPAVLKQMDNEQLQNIPIGGFLGLGATAAPTASSAPTILPTVAAATAAASRGGIPTTAAAAVGAVPVITAAPTAAASTQGPKQQIADSGNVADNRNVVAPPMMAQMPQQAVPQMIASNFNPIGQNQGGMGAGTGGAGGAGTGGSGVAPGPPASLPPVDCQVIGWSNWSPCVAGSTQRVRTQITNGGPFNGGAACPALQKETDNSFCPVDCKVTGWGDWTPCKTGSTQRTRTQATTGPFNGGAACSNLQTEIDNSGCSVDCQYTGWGEWSACGPDGKRTRTQTFSGPFNGGKACTPQTETDISTCPVDSTISGWTDWTACQSGSTIRTRTQATVPARNGGATVRPATETDTSTCAVDCQYTGWGQWSACVPGTNVRTRTQMTRPPLNAGAVCAPQTETDTTYCPIDASAAGWTDWSTCIPGSTRRTRTQITRPPINNGATMRPVTENDDSYCSVDCKFSMDFKTPLDGSGGAANYMCDISAGGYRNYKVTMLQPAINNGQPCMYQGTVVTEVGQLVPSGDPCPVDSVVTGWGDWSPCLQGDSTRTRMEVTRPPIHNGATVRPNTEMDPSTCPVNCKFGLDFSNNVTCDDATGKKNFTVSKYIAPINDGSACIFQGTAVRAVGQVVPSNVDCSVNCVASYNGVNTCIGGKYYQTYNVTKLSLNSGGRCTVNDGSYSVVFDASAIGPYSVQVDTCSDCSYTLQDLSLTDYEGGCDFTTGLKKYKVAQYIPPVRSKNTCAYGTQTITGTDQPPFISPDATAKCPVDCSFTQAAQLPGTSACVAASDGKSYKKYKLSNYVAPKNGGSCNYTNNTTLRKAAVVGLDANLQFLSPETCSNCSYTETFNGCVNGKRQYISSNYVAATGGGTACANGVTGNGQTYNKGEACSNCDEYNDANFSDCTKTCGGGKKYKYHHVRTHGSNGGTTCTNDTDGSIAEVQDCNTQSCDADCTFTQQVIACDDGYKQYRIQSVNNKVANGKDCKITYKDGSTAVITSQHNGNTYSSNEACDGQGAVGWGAAQRFKCPAGKFISKIEGSSFYGHPTTGLKFTCNDNTSGKLGVMDRVDHTINAPYAIDKIDFKYGEYYGWANGIQYLSANDQEIGNMGWSGNIQSYNTTCSNGQAIVGVYGDVDNTVKSIGFICGDATIPSKSQSSTSDKYGGSGGTPFSDTCPNGKFVTKLSGRSGGWIDGIRATCDDGTTLPYHGGGGGDEVNSSNCPGGMNGVTIKWGGGAWDGAGSIHAMCNNGTDGGKFGGDLIDKKTTYLYCPTGQYVNGIVGNSGWWLDSFGINCKTPY